MKKIFIISVLIFFTFCLKAQYGGNVLQYYGVTASGGSGSSSLNLDTVRKDLAKQVLTNIIAATSSNYTVLVNAGDTIKKVTLVNSSIGHTIAAYGAGTIYTLTNTAALLHFGTTDPSITIDIKGTYLVFVYVSYRASGATIAALDAAYSKVRRTNNTAADISGASYTDTIQVMTTTSMRLGPWHISPFIYTTSNDATHGTGIADILQVWGSFDTAPSVGKFLCTRADIVAIKIY